MAERTELNSGLDSFFFVPGNETCDGRGLDRAGESQADGRVAPRAGLAAGHDAACDGCGLESDVRDGLRLAALFERGDFGEIDEGLGHGSVLEPAHLVHGFVELLLE